MLWLLCRLFRHHIPFTRSKISWMSAYNSYELQCNRCHTLIKRFSTFTELKEHLNGTTKPKSRTD